ncbi:hypothetical protein ACGFS9_30570 [Streptomyces sp. NPDC048566]|uniref:hypothetical protein n=1 Tax=Streptomyces sp. NPDC048566 TaxID=3365569 RepID=UPI0037171822
MGSCLPKASATVSSGLRTETASGRAEIVRIVAAAIYCYRIHWQRCVPISD